MSTLSKRALDRIAAALKDGHASRPTGGTPATQTAWVNGFAAAVEAVADAAQAELDRFQPDRFYAAVGMIKVEPPADSDADPLYTFHHDPRCSVCGIRAESWDELDSSERCDDCRP